MSDAKLTADIVIKFNKESLKFFNGLIKNTEKGLRTLERTSESVFANLGKVNKTAMNSAVAAGKAQVKLEKSVTQASEVVANSEKRIARATLETSKAIIQNARVLDKAKTERKENTKAIKEGAKVASKASKEKSAAAKKESSEDAKLAARLRRVSREKAKLNKVTKEGTKASEKRASTATKNALAIGGLTAALARYRVILGLVQFAASAAFKAIAIPAGIITGWVTFLGVAARGEREINKMARSVQVGTGFLKAFSMATKDAGLSADNAIDMLEEMSNKVGDGLETPTHGTAMAFRELGLNLKEVQKMSRQKGLTTIMDSIVKFRKAGGGDQQTVRLADEIFGGEGNKFAGYLLESGELFSDLIERNKEYNMVSDETSTRMDKFGKSLELARSAAMGIVNEGLSEEFEVIGQLLDKLTNYFKNNKEGIANKIAEIGKSITDLGVKIVKVFADPKNLQLFQGALDGIIIALNGAVNALEGALSAWSKFNDVASDFMVGDTNAAIRKITDTEGEDVEGTIKGLLYTLASTTNAGKLATMSHRSLTAPSPSDNSKKEVTINNNFNMSGDNQQQVAEEASQSIIEITESN